MTMARGTGKSAGNCGIRNRNAADPCRYTNYDRVISRSPANDRMRCRCRGAIFISPTNQSGRVRAAAILMAVDQGISNLEYFFAGE